MTTIAVDNDPYVLAVPGPDSPVVTPQWVTPGNSHPNSRYRDPVWSLGPLIDNPGVHLYTIRWKNCPATVLGQLKRVAWVMINGRLRPTYLRNRGVNFRSRMAAGGMQENCNEWMRFARWVHERHHVTSLGSCTEEVWRAYMAERCQDLSRDHAKSISSHLSDLWAFDQLSAEPTGVAQPPWEVRGVDDFLPAAEGPAGGENSREPLAPQVLGPLVVWAIRFVDDFADDILAAWAERRHLIATAAANRGSFKSRVALEEFLPPRTTGAPLPTVSLHGENRLARSYVAALTGASLAQVDWLIERDQLTALANERPGPCPLRVPVTGRINGKPWREHMDFGEAPDLMRHLGTAAAIICLYLTGMRGQEVQALRVGCCPDPEPAAEGTSGRHLIRSHHFKNVTDDDGNHISAGEEREVPWVAITPVVNAIRVLERMVPEGELLLSASHHRFSSQRAFHGAIKKHGLRRRVEGFVRFANDEARAQGLFDQLIPDDPHGPIGVSRFRRTLAWHIARRPGGLIALAIQYGHMRTVLDARVSSGYGSRSRSGIHSVLDVETALAAADTAAHLRDRVAAGEKVSGPAAHRALAAAATALRFEGRIVTKAFTKKAAAFLSRDGVVLFDNPEAFLICAFKRDNALCAPDPGETAPKQYDCQPGCGNAVRTDTHARQLRERAEEIDLLATSAPGPLGERLRANADRLRTTADIHDATAEPCGTAT